MLAMITSSSRDISGTYIDIDTRHIPVHTSRYIIVESPFRVLFKPRPVYTNAFVPSQRDSLAGASPRAPHPLRGQRGRSTCQRSPGPSHFPASLQRASTRQPPKPCGCAPRMASPLEISCAICWSASPAWQSRRQFGVGTSPTAPSSPGYWGSWANQRKPAALLRRCDQQGADARGAGIRGHPRRTPRRRCRGAGAHWWSA